MKTTRLVHPSHARTVLSETDAARLRAQGWRELPEDKPVGKSAAWQRRFRERRRTQGKKPFTAWVSEQVYGDLMAARKPGESIAGLLERIAKSLRSEQEKR